MTYAPRRPQLGSTLNHGGRIRLFLDSRLQRSRSGRAWYGSAFDWRTKTPYRVLSPDWLPIGTVLVCDGRADIDCWLVNLEQTQLENAIPQEWLDANRPGEGEIQIHLFP